VEEYTYQFIELAHYAPEEVDRNSKKQEMFKKGLTPELRTLLTPQIYSDFNCKTPDFHRKPESLYRRDSPWISGYRVQNVSQNDTQSHTSHHIKLIVH
jgi:hypothetical protein